ncbi:MAG TPA: ABC transporter permease [Acidobacteriota bacterium]
MTERVLMPLRADRRGPLAGAALFAAATVLGLGCGALMIALTGGDVIAAYGALLRGAFGSLYGLTEMLMSTTPLIFAGLAVAFAFHGGLFNIGVEGQLLVGGLAAGWAGYAVAGLPRPLHLLLALGVGFSAGALWGALAGWLKAWRGVHEVISTIMLNYVAFRFCSFMVGAAGPLKAEGQLPATPFVLESARLSRLIAGTRFSGGIVLALLAAAAVGYLLWRTRLGYRIRAVGQSPPAAEAGGIAPRRQMAAAMAISGGLAGLAGAVEVLGLHYRFYDAFSPGYGFDGIAVALLGQIHPAGVTAAALLFGALRAGAAEMQQVAQISRDVIFAISGAIIFFIALRGLLAPPGTARSA